MRPVVDRLRGLGYLLFAGGAAGLLTYISWLFIVVCPFWFIKIAFILLLLVLVGGVLIIATDK